MFDLEIASYTCCCWNVPVLYSIDAPMRPMLIWLNGFVYGSKCGDDHRHSKDRELELIYKFDQLEFLHATVSKLVYLTSLAVGCSFLNK